ncbi:SpaA isopeptide-forming pilin-related protein, partial [uncultured Clostridium sp.]|uniref:SpaA isopeptide-forming pilin-related protein n=1 Tax=uncultured Clostridium sp. TaxID=59620 RepID=UPI002612D7BD
DSKAQTVTITEKNAATLKLIPFKDTKINIVVVKGQLTIAKEAIENGNVVMNNGKPELLGGAIFEITGPNNYKNTVTTIANEKLVVNDLQLGKYTVKEVQAPTGYKLDSKAQIVTITEKNAATLKLTPFKDTKEVVTQYGSLQITKTNESGKVFLDGATFSLYNSKNELVGSYTTENGGIVKVDKQLAYGTYYLVETLAPTGYELNNSKIYVTIDSEKTKNVTVSDKKEQVQVKYGQLEIIKENTDKQLLAGAKFDLFNSKTNELIGSYTTKADGKILVDKKLAYGEYYLQEVKAPTGYILNTDKIKVTINSEQIKHVTVTDKKESVEVKYGALEITKQNTAGKLLSGATFNLFNSNDKLIGSYTTQANGVILVDKKLAYGEYYLQEVKAPIGYELNTQKIKVSINSEKIQNITVTDKKKDVEVKYGQLEIIKKGTNGDLLAGATFDLYNVQSGKLIGSYTTESNGKILVGQKLAYGEYYVQEVQAPNGYELNNNKIYVTINSGKVQDVTVTDKKAEVIVKYGQLEITKESVGGKLLGGATFNLYNSTNNLVGTYTTESNGKILVDQKLVFGEYHLQEVKAPVGYQVNKEPFKFVINKEGIENVTVIDKEAVVIIKTGDIKITKKSTDGKLLGGAKFGLYNSIGNLIGEYTTNSDGYIIVNKLKYGNYSIKELVAPAGYELNNEKVNFTVDSQGVKTLTVVDKKDETVVKHGSLKITKESTTGKLLGGAVFGIYTSEGQLQGKYTTDLQGYITVNNLVYGNYYLKELKSPIGYEINKEQVNFVINNQGVTTLTVIDKLIHPSINTGGHKDHPSINTGAHKEHSNIIAGGDNSSTITVSQNNQHNTSNVTLPKTGSVLGTDGLLGLGLLLTIGSLGAILFDRRRRF